MRAQHKAGGGAAAGTARRARAARPLLGFGALLDRASHQFESLLGRRHHLADEGKQDAGHVLVGCEARTSAVQRVDDQRVAPSNRPGSLNAPFQRTRRPGSTSRTRGRKLTGFMPGAAMVMSKRSPTRGSPVARTMNGFQSE